MSVEIISSHDKDKDTLRFYGGNLEAVLSREKIVILVGPAGTGKTYALCTKMHLFAVKYPGVKILLCRKSLPALRNSAVKTYQKVLDKFEYTDKVRVLGESRPTNFIYDYDEKEWDGKVYKGKSEITLSQIDTKGKALGAEYDMIYVNQPDTEGLTEEEFTQIASRARLPYAPYRQILSDPNPAHDQHWLIQGTRKGFNGEEPKWRFYESSHKDNPEYFDWDKEEWTLVGQEHLRQLELLPEHLKQSQLRGEWYSLAGMAFADYWNIDHKHVLYLESEEAMLLGLSEPDGFGGFKVADGVRHWEHYLAIDWGFDEPFVAILIAKHPTADKLIVHRHIYISEKDIDYVSALTAEMVAPFNLKAVIADRGKPETFTMEKFLDMPIITARKGNYSVADSLNICISQLNSDRWKFIPTLDSLYHEPDPKLVAGRKLMGYEEIPNLKKDEKTGNIAPKQQDHFYDAWKYFCRWWAEEHGGAKRKTTIVWI